MYEKRDLGKTKCQNCGKKASIVGTKAIILYAITTDGKIAREDAGYVKYNKMIYFWCEDCARKEAIKTLEYF